jgi:hypothetical protein
MHLEFGFRTKVTCWRGFGSAGVPPAVLQRGTSTTIVGWTPALRNSALYDESRDHRSDHSNRREISGLNTGKERFLAAPRASEWQKCEFFHEQLGLRAFRIEQIQNLQAM